MLKKEMKNYYYYYLFHIKKTLVMMASLWYQDQSDTDLLEKINLAMDHWFSNDFTEDDCINAGGIELLKCPCGTPGFWNSNWWYQVFILILYTVVRYPAYL